VLTFRSTAAGRRSKDLGDQPSAQTIAKAAVRDLTTVECQERSNQAYALHLLGEIATHRDPSDVRQAEDHYRQALALAKALGMRPLQAHCHRGLGTLYVKTGKREQSRTELGAAIELYRVMDMTLWLPQAEAALAQVEER
jgi:tetratricopeptide (TPR) repeat protein